MRKSILPLVGAATLAVASTVAGAADLPRRAAPPIFTPVPVFTWTGFYIGANAGYAFGVSEKNDNYYFPAGSIVNSPGTDGVLAFSGRGDRGGFSGGGQVGYNYQFTPGSGVVVGVEADAQYIDLGRGRGVFGPADYTFSPTGGTIPNLGVAFVPQSGLIPGLNNPTIFRSSPGIGDFFGTVRGRLGYAFDRVLFFGTGGFAYADGGSSNGFNTVGFNKKDDFRTGYAVGGGVEYAFLANWTARVEFLYVNLDQGRGTATASFDPVANTVTVVTNGGSQDFSVVRGAVNYKFGTF